MKNLPNRPIGHSDKAAPTAKISKHSRHCVVAPHEKIILWILLIAASTAVTTQVQRKTRQIDPADDTCNTCFYKVLFTSSTDNENHFLHFLKNRNNY
jgi:hypothetical protein